MCIANRKGIPCTSDNVLVTLKPGTDLGRVYQQIIAFRRGVAEKGNSENLPLGTTIHVAGFPQGSSTISFLSGSISSRVTKPEDGYAFIYTVNAFPDMSGGPILDEQGKLVGIHGRSITRPDTSAVTALGIPLKTYLSLVSSAKPMATAPAPNPPNPPVSTAPSAPKFTLARTLIGHSQKDSSYNFSEKEGAVYSVAFSPDGKTLASGSRDETIKIWNLASPIP